MTQFIFQHPVMAFVLALVALAVIENICVNFAKALKRRK